MVTDVRRDNTRKTSGRVTPAKSRRGVQDSSGRYTPPIPRAVKVSPPWVPVLMGALLVLGALMIILNYLELLPGGANNAYLLVGLGLITAGFVTATQWH